MSRLALSGQAALFCKGGRWFQNDLGVEKPVKYAFSTKCFYTLDAF